MQTHNIKIHALQALDQKVARFRSDYLSLSEADRRALQLRLASRKAAPPIGANRDSVPLHIVTNEDGSMKSVVLDPTVLLEAMHIWDKGECFAPSADMLFRDSPIA